VEDTGECLRLAAVAESAAIDVVAAYEDLQQALSWKGIEVGRFRKVDLGEQHERPAALIRREGLAGRPPRTAA
jgi:hypothetical protein